MFTNNARSHLADVCQPACYRLAAVEVECKHEITWLSSANRNHCL